MPKNKEHENEAPKTEEIQVDRHADGTATLTKGAATLTYLGKGAMDRTWNFKEINGSIAGLDEQEAFEKAFEIAIKHPALLVQEEKIPETVENRVAENEKVEQKIIDSEQQDLRGDELEREDKKHIPAGEHPKDEEQPGDNTVLEDEAYEKDAKKVSEKEKKSENKKDDKKKK